MLAIKKTKTTIFLGDLHKFIFFWLQNVSVSSCLPSSACHLSRVIQLNGKVWIRTTKLIQVDSYVHTVLCRDKRPPHLFIPASSGPVTGLSPFSVRLFLLPASPLSLRRLGNSAPTLVSLPSCASAPFQSVQAVLAKPLARAPTPASSLLACSSHLQAVQ